MSRIHGVLILGLLLAVPGVVGQAEEKQGGSQSEVAGEASASKAEPAPDARENATAKAQTRPVLYRPPKVGKPAQSVGGGTRGRSDRDPVLFALVPDHVGQTSSQNPALFWFVDRPLNAPVKVEFTLHADGEIEPAIESEIAVPIAEGIHRVRLSDYGFQLEPGVEYEWSIAIVFSPDQPAEDVVATGWIERVEPSGLGALLAARGEAEAARIYAEQGLWYDALTAVDQRISAGPEADAWISVRSDLLKQVGLGVAAGS